MSGFLNALDTARHLSPAQLLGDRPLVVIAPHPDDETLGCGALLFDAARRGNACHIVCVTDGSRSHPNSRIWPADRIAQVRQQELRAACAILAPTATISWMGHGDCQVPDDAHTATILDALIPSNALVLASWAMDPHIDHRRVASLAQRVAADRSDITVGFYPIWGRFTDLIAPADLIIASDPAKAAKRQALACHRTQMTRLIDDDPAGFVMTDAHQSHFLSHPEIVIALKRHP